MSWSDTLLNALLCRASSMPDAVLVRDVSRNLVFTANHLKKLVVKLGEALLAQPLGIASSAVLEVPFLCALIVNEGFYLAATEMALLLLSVPFIPIHPNDPSERITFIKAKVGVTHSFELRELEQVINDVLRDEGPVVLHSQVEASVSAVVRRSPNYSCLEGRYAPDHYVAYLITTSGSTGMPKVVVAERRQLRSYVEGFVTRSHDDGGLGITASSRILLLSSCTFDPSIGDIATVLAVEGSVLFTASRSDIEGPRIVNVLRSANPTLVVTTPALWGTVPLPGPEDAFIQGDCMVCLGGERMSLNLRRRWQSCTKLYNIYGVTEATVYQSLIRMLPENENVDTISSDLGTAACIGQTPCSIEATIAFEESDAIGEVILSGDQVCRGYFDELSGEVPSSGRFQMDSANRRSYHTGDFAFIAPFHSKISALWLVGRRDFQVKLNGQRIALEEVERQLRLLGPTVGQVCCCTCSPSDERNIRLCAMVEIRGQFTKGIWIGSSDEGWGMALYSQLVKFLPPVMTPSYWIVIAPDGTAPADLSTFPQLNFFRESLQSLLTTNLHKGIGIPETSSGKLNRSVVKNMFEDALQHEQERSQVCSVPTGQLPEPLLPLFATIRSIWERLLGVPLRSTSHFFRLGGDSLSALKMTRQVYLFLHHDDDSEIDAHGNMPPAFDPSHVALNPTLLAYTLHVGSSLSNAHSSSTETTREEDVSDSQVLSDNTVLIKLIDQRIDVPASSSGERGMLLAAVAFCIDHLKMNPNGAWSRNHSCTTPLHAAVAAQDAEVVELLTRRGAKPNVINADGVTPAHLAAMLTSTTILERILNADFPAAARDRRQQSLLHCSARFGSLLCTLHLLNVANLDPLVRDCWQRTPLHWAVLNGHSETARALIHHIMNRDASRFKEKRLRGGVESEARSTRLAQRRTFLPYETVRALAQRLYGKDSAMYEMIPNDFPAI